VRELDYKTVRYPGHAAKIGLLRDLGFFAEAPMDFQGSSVRPRDLTAELLTRSLDQGDERDLVVFRVDAQGLRNGRPARRRMQLLDAFDEATGLSAMRRCTAFPAAQVLRMLVAGDCRGPGAHALETAIEAEPCLAALRARGLAIAEIPWED
jgi:lysine 6-dehydrogenase